MTKLDVFPNELKQLNQWICWKSVKKDGAEKPTKVPCAPETGVSIDPSKQLYSHTEVCQYVEKYKENVSGIGFYFNGNGISGIDLDNCIDASGNLSEDARQIIDKLDSYTEISPSGKGFHILFRGQLPPGSHNRGPNHEVYSDKRYFTMTGNVFENRTNFESRQEQLEWFVENYVQPKKLSQSDEIIKLIQRSKIADKFERLMNGDISAYDDDDSKADAALMSILAFFTKKNVLLMEEIFNKSKLAMRDKWKNRQDYRDRTINYAIENTREIYAGREILDSPINLPTQDEQIKAANSVLDQFENPCAQFDTRKLPQLVRRYVDHVCSTTDADPMVVTTSFIGMISGVLKKSAYIPEVDSEKKPNECYFERLYPNVYFLNVMPSGSFKTTALNKAFKLAYDLESKRKAALQTVQNSECGNNHEGELKLEYYRNLPQSVFLPHKSTVEALLDDLNELGGGVIALSEFGSWLQEMEKNYNLGLKSLFTNFFDVPKSYSVSTKSAGRITIERPYISIVGVSTLDWVKANIDVKDVSTGFFARFLIFNPPIKPQVPSALPTRKFDADKTIEQEILNIFLSKIPITPREYCLSMEANDRFNEIHNLLYERFYKLPDHTRGIIDPFIKRWSPYILKIGMILQFMTDPESNEIGIEAISGSYEIVKYAIKSTTYLFNHELAESKHDALCRKLLQFIAKRTKRGIETTWREILQSRVSREGVKEYESIVRELLESGQLIRKSGAERKDDIYSLNTRS